MRNGNALHRSAQASHAPEFERMQLKRKIAQVRADLAKVLAGIDIIRLRVNPQLRAEYAVKVGHLENEVLQARVALQRAQRRLKLAQARRGVEAGMACETPEAALDADLREAELQLVEQVEEYVCELEMRSRLRAMNPVQSRVLDSLFSLLVGRLHPDLHPEHGSGGQRIFQIAQSAFEAGDVNALQSIEVATCSLAEKGAYAGTIEELYVQYELFCAQLRVSQGQLDALMQQAPYTLHDKLSDATWVQKQVTRCKQEISLLDQAREEVEAECMSLEGALPGAGPL